MKRDDLVKSLKKLGLRQKQALQAVDVFFLAISRSLKEGKKVSIVGFGTWEWRSRSARLARNPKTGKTLSLGQRKVLIFKPSPGLKRRLKGR